MAGTLQIVQISSLLLTPFSERLLVQANSNIVGTVWTIMQYIFEKRQKAHITFSGDRLPEHESAIVISNHRSWTDFYLLHSVAMRRKMLSNCKYFVKDSLKWIPFFGWGMWIADFIFVQRNWLQDQRRIHKTFSNIKKLQTPVWIMSFAEGTRITAPKLLASQAIAKDRGYKIMHHVLLPRTKGFVTCVNEFRFSHVKYVYDFTIAYLHKTTKAVEFNVAPNMVRLHTRRLDKEYDFHVHVRRYAIADLPQDDEALAAWLRDRYVDKDTFLSQMEKNWTHDLEIWEE